MKQIIIKKENMITGKNSIFQGWGSSLCWWANRIGYSDKLTELAAELFYGKSGLELNIMRYNIGGGDNPSHHHITRTDSMIPGWTKYNTDKKTFEYDYTADQNQLNVLEKCYKKAGSCAYVEAFSNSAPYYMTKSGCSSGGTDPSINNLKDDCYDEFASYLAHVCSYIENKLHINISSIAAMNEPNTDFWIAMSQKQEGCHFDAGSSQSKLLVSTKNAFDKIGLDKTEVTASDETSTEKQLLACNSYSPEALKIIDRISTHTYETTMRKEMGQYAKEHNLKLWMSEVDGNFTIGENADQMKAALGLAQKIIDDINELAPSAWVLWQLIDSHISSHGCNGNKDFGMPDTDKGYWGTAIADHNNETIILTKKYYAFGQFTKYIRPDTRLIICDRHTLAAYDSRKQQLSIVAVNIDEKEADIRFDISGFSIKDAKSAVIRTSGDIKNGENWKHCASVMVKNGILDVTLKGYSITTFVVE